MLGEDAGKSLDVSGWGLPVNLQATVALSDAGED